MEEGAEQKGSPAMDGRVSLHMAIQDLFFWFMFFSPSPLGNEVVWGIISTITSHSHQTCTEQKRKLFSLFFPFATTEGEEQASEGGGKKCWGVRGGRKKIDAGKKQ